jgi:hypothetical protein
MSPDFINASVVKLTEVYGANCIRIAKDGARTLTRIESVELYEGCSPRATPLLLVFDPAQEKPLPFVSPGQKLANGKDPRSTSVQSVGGESWMGFSFNISWQEEHGIIRFLAAARQRFAQKD